MNKNRFLRVLLTGIVLLAFTGGIQATPPAREFYQITVYHFKNAEQEKLLDSYLEKAWVPAMHRQGFSKLGVFKAWANDTASDKTLYVFLPLKSLDQLNIVNAKLLKDASFQLAATEYNNALHSAPPYTRIETILTHAFALAPQMNTPLLKGPKKERVYELRSYESATEKLFRNKVQMFNEGGEIDIFNKLQFNAVFYSEVIAGDKMPNLMYMTSFENRADRDAHWKSFVDDAQWKKLSAMPEYKDNVSHIDIYLLWPVEYSDI